MIDKPLTKAELQEVYDAPARRNPERSRAHHADTYRDPSACVKFERERIALSLQREAKKLKYAR